MNFIEKSYEAELVIVGAGMPGICAAIQAARRGVSVALINDRGVLGGNSSAEIGVHVNGASDGGPLNINSREGGIVSEILTEYKNRSPVHINRYIFDGVLIDFVNREKNIKLFLNTCIDSAKVQDNAIKSVSGTQNTTETHWTFTGRWFVDNTGDGALGALSGAEFMLGRESKDTFDESIAPDKADKYVIPSTLIFNAYDAGYKIPYKAPDFAFDIPASGALERRVIPQETFHQTQWYYEIGGEYDHVYDRESIIADHKKLIFGIWDYIKNSGKYPQADTYDIGYMSCIPGTREYRRLVGDYILTEKDIANQSCHEDTVGHGGWNIDLHALKGFFDDDIVNRHIHSNGVYKIPYRTSYSKNINNLFMCGRCMSCSHVAFGSTRVMSTLSTIGQAVGMAAALCKKYNTTPRGIYEKHIHELQQQLLKEDQLILGVKNEDNEDLAKDAKVSSSSTQKLELQKQITVDVDKIMDSVAPEYRSRLRHGYNGITDSINLDSGLALSIPINKKLDSLRIKARSNNDTSLEYRVYLPTVTENYGPDKLVFKGNISIEKNDQFTWFDLPINIDVDNSYVLVELRENPSIDIAIGGEYLPNTIMFRSFINHNTNVVDYSTLKMSDRTWQRSPLSICYQTIPEQLAYGACNIINGYNRAYGQTNMWLSSIDDDTPKLTLKWDKPVEFSKVQITFGVDTTKHIYWEQFEPIYDLVGQDYMVYAKVNGENKLLADIKDNFKKVNKLDIDTVETDKITFEFNKSNNGQIGVYEIRVYR